MKKRLLFLFSFMLIASTVTQSAIAGRLEGKLLNAITKAGESAPNEPLYLYSATIAADDDDNAANALKSKNIKIINLNICK